MLYRTTAEQISALILAEHPLWDETAVEKRANEYHLVIDACLDDVIQDYLGGNELADYSSGEFSILKIKALRRNCGWFDACVMMNGYIKDALNGKAVILRS